MEFHLQIYWNFVGNNLEFLLKKNKMPTYRMKREEVKTVIFTYYNTQRITSFNEGDLPPVALRTSKQLSHHAA